METKYIQNKKIKMNLTIRLDKEKRWREVEVK